ncbi:MAG: TetR/AcrR family transcriptional regulator [Deltaproteobacteria bacterium]|nr:TetR/AcrR family transcriptional regulator [Deltaproteobacteria bacterium]MBW2394268.1 TetR/AcrR family transcriptional regulator [Deltaproteobacteria bacterium]
MPAPEAQTADSNSKRERIIDAALEKFSAYGYARTSMADIAEAAEMSRPALYLHFENKNEIFRAALETILGRAFSRALEALEPSLLTGRTDAQRESGIAKQLTEFLQRYHGDLMELFAEKVHGDDFLTAKQSQAADILASAAKRSRARLTRYFNGLVARGAFDPERSGQSATQWIELILLSPYGLRQDQPGVAQYRKRLDALATSVAAGMRGSRSTRRKT